MKRSFFEKQAKPKTISFKIFKVSNDDANRSAHTRNKKRSSPCFSYFFFFEQTIKKLAIKHLLRHYSRNTFSNASLTVAVLLISFNLIPTTPKMWAFVYAQCVLPSLPWHDSSSNTRKEEKNLHHDAGEGSAKWTAKKNLFCRQLRNLT